MNGSSEFADELRRVKPDAVRRLFDQFHQPLYRFFLGRSGSHELAEEATAESFVQLMKALPSFRGDDSQIRGYIYAIARRAESRCRSKLPTRQTSDECINACNLHDPNESPLGLLMLKETLGNVLGTLQKLEPLVRDIILLRYLEELTIDEIATAVKLPVGTVKSHLHRGRKRLRELNHSNDKQLMEAHR